MADVSIKAALPASSEALTAQPSDCDAYVAPASDHRRSSSPTRPSSACDARRSRAQRSRYRCRARWFGRGTRSLRGPPGLTASEITASTVSRLQVEQCEMPREGLHRESNAERAVAVDLATGASTSCVGEENIGDEPAFRDTRPEDNDNKEKTAPVSNVHSSADEILLKEHTCIPAASSSATLRALDLFCEELHATDQAGLKAVEDYSQEWKDRLERLTERAEALLSEENVCEKVCAAWDLLGQTLEDRLGEYALVSTACDYSCAAHDDRWHVDNSARRDLDPGQKNTSSASS
mmetsp:Transcript_28675/g.95192  ORF Transcript_28675/g.95192 Transcript_28675/m.95192 type:complete len:293 (+) Transcript_28675:49-927(+)